MSELTNRWEAFFEEWERGVETDYTYNNFINALMFSTPTEIISLLNLTEKSANTLLPPFLHVWSYRILTLLEPNNPAILRRAAKWLLQYSEWDDHAAALNARANEIDERREGR